MPFKIRRRFNVHTDLLWKRNIINTETNQYRKKGLLHINSLPWRMSTESVRSQDIQNYLFKPVYDMLWTFCPLWFSSELCIEIMNWVLQRYWKTVMENIKNEQYCLSCMVSAPLLTEIPNCGQYLNTLYRHLCACLFGLYFSVWTWHAHI